MLALTFEASSDGPDALQVGLDSGDGAATLFRPPDPDRVPRQSPMYAVLDDRNQQYRVAQGDKIKIHLRADANEGDTLTFDKVCAVGGEADSAGKVGTPFVDGASVTAKVIKNVKGPKVIIGKMRRRKDFRKRTGFRAQYTMIQIESING